MRADCRRRSGRVAHRARQTDTFRNDDLRHHTYQDIKAGHGLGAQAAQHVTKKVADAYTTLTANLKAGRYAQTVSIWTVSGRLKQVAFTGSPGQVKAVATHPVGECDLVCREGTCAECGYRDKRNRPDQETFHCGSCGVVAHADHNEARNIAARAVTGWGTVNRPHAA